MTRVATRHGFVYSMRLGFVGLARGNQRCDLFRWSNQEISERTGSPRAYLVVCLTLNGDLEDGGRWRIPLVEGTSADLPLRPWSEIYAEFDEIFLPHFETRSRPSLPPRYHLGAPHQEKEESCGS